MVFSTGGYFEVAIESWPEWDLNTRPLNHIYVCVHPYNICGEATAHLYGEEQSF